MTTEPVSSPDLQPKQQNFFERIAGVLFAPADTFQDIARRPDVLWPLLLIVLSGYLSAIVITPRLDMSSIEEQQREAMRKSNRKLSEEDMERVAKFGAASAKVGIFAAPVVFIVWYVIVAAVLLFACRLFGGEGTFGQAFSATLYAWIPLLILGIISTIVVFARGTFDPITAATLVKSNAAFLVDMKEQPALFALLSALDVFTIWTIVLLIFGFAALSKLSLKTTASIVVSIWIALILVRVGWTAMMAARMAA
jgi:hypothetical protein